MAFQLLKFQRVFSFFLRKRTLIRAYSEDAQNATEETEGAEASGPPDKKSLVLGAYTTDDNTFKLTEAANGFDKRTGGRVTQLLNELGRIDLGDVQVYHNMDPEFYSVAVAGLGPEHAGLNPFECLDEAKENTRIAAGVAARALQAGGVEHIYVEAFNGQTEAAAEGACLGIWKFQDTKSKDDQRCIPTLDLFEDEDKGGWQRGINKAEAQNIARRLSEMPSNLLTPTLFAQAAVDYLCPCGVQVLVRDKEFIQENKMNSFLSVSRGSSEVPILLECVYSGSAGGDDQPIVLVGKGITHDLGGLCRKKCKDMAEFRADMSGAAAIVGTMRAIAALNLPINVTAVIPLCENVPSGMALKPGDVVTTVNGRTIKVENTDHEGTLILADAFVYSMATLKPKLLLDIATLTHGARHSLGAGATAAFVTNDKLWQELEKAGACTGDRMWRLPLWDYYTNKITKPRNADMTNAGIGPGGTTCLAAAFLREFVPCGDWIHLDTHGTGMLHHPADVPYMKEGKMSGRPTRTLIQFLQQYVNYEA